MARLMSVTLTEDAVRERRKTVSRRANWWEDKNGRRLLPVGSEVDLCRKVMGRKPGEPLVRIARVRVLDVRREPLSAITEGDVIAEGLTYVDLTGYACSPRDLRLGFCRFYVNHMGGSIDQEVTRIEWEYLPTPADWIVHRPDCGVPTGRTWGCSCHSDPAAYR